MIVAPETAVTRNDLLLGKISKWDNARGWNFVIYQTNEPLSCLSQSLRNWGTKDAVDFWKGLDEACTMVETHIEKFVEETTFMQYRAEGWINAYLGARKPGNRDLPLLEEYSGIFEMKYGDSWFLGLEDIPLKKEIVKSAYTEFMVVSHMLNAYNAKSDVMEYGVVLNLTFPDKTYPNAGKADETVKETLMNLYRNELRKYTFSIFDHDEEHDRKVIEFPFLKKHE